FEGRLLPVLVPPWNRLDESLLPNLAALGFAGLSAYGPRPAAGTHGLTQVNCHLDLIDWQGSRGFLGETAALALLTGHLAARREGRVDPEEPSGILSHHRDHDPETSDFLTRLLTFLAKQPGARFPATAEVFAMAGVHAIALS
ncbi:MAG: polysaccharide deacetylase family protein, partial [Kiloniellales bacterium]